jgi:adenylate cyclase
MFGKLVPCGGGPPIPLGKATVVLGRHPGCDVPVACPSVSGRHCELEFRDGSWWVRDLGSKNGTAVNGVKRESQRVEPDSVLSVGRQRFVLAYQPGARPPRPAAAKDDVEALALSFLTEEEPPPPARPVAAGGSRPGAAPAPPPRVAAAVPGPQLSKTPLPARATLGKLVPCGGGDPIALLLPELTVGRSPACDVCLPFPSVSGKHCRLNLQEGYWFVQDLNSSNGTWVNGVRCQHKCLPPGGVLGLAKHRFTVHYTPAGAGPPPEEDDIFAQSLLEKAGLAKQMRAGRLPGTRPDEDDADERPRYRLDPDE